MRRLLFVAVVFVMAAGMTARAEAILQPVSFAALPGWAEDDHAAALAAFNRSCAETSSEGRAFDRAPAYGGGREDWIDVCKRAAAARDPRAFFEDAFTALSVADPARAEGLFTGYYEPEARGNRVRTAEFTVPIYRRPADLVSFDQATEQRLGLRYGRMGDQGPQGYFTRAEIEDGALAGQGLEIAWLADRADAFFIHIQGSGRVRLPDGSLLRLAYAAKTGQPYTGIGGVLVERGVLSKDNMSMQAIRAWMRQDPEAGRAIMRENKSFVFFREVEAGDPGLGPPGAQKVALTPLRSLAVDRGLWVFGTPIWLDTAYPPADGGAAKMFRRLMIAQDTGTAIRGHVRGDVFWGAGEEAALIAGHMKSPGRMSVLLPKALAARLLNGR